MNYEVWLITNRDTDDETFTLVEQYDNAGDAVKYIFLKLSIQDGYYQIVTRIDGNREVLGWYCQQLNPQ